MGDGTRLKLETVACALLVELRGSSPVGGCEATGQADTPQIQSSSTVVVARRHGALTEQDDNLRVATIRTSIKISTAVALMCLKKGQAAAQCHGREMSVVHVCCGCGNMISLFSL